ncbi:hypothetical protein Tco_1569869 [Tanacetum coccineum]
MPRGTTQVVTRGASNDWCQMCRYEVRGGRASVRGDGWTNQMVTRGTGVCQSENHLQHCPKSRALAVSIELVVDELVDGLLVSLEVDIRCHECQLLYLSFSSEKGSKVCKDSRRSSGTRDNQHDYALLIAKDSKGCSCQALVGVYRNRHTGYLSVTIMTS